VFDTIICIYFYPGTKVDTPFKDRTRENIGRHTYSVVLKFFVERTDFTKSLMSTKKQLNIIVNKKQRT